MASDLASCARSTLSKMEKDANSETGSAARIVGDAAPVSSKTEKNITYEREMDTAIAEVDQGRAQICFLLNPVSVETVAEMAMAGEVLPQKSTDFFPKLMSGITMYRLRD